MQYFYFGIRNIFEVYMDTIDRIFKTMKEKQLSAYAVSKNTGIANSTISDWKKGKGRPSADNIAALADYFNVSTDYLLGRTDNPSFAPPTLVLTPDEQAAVEAFLAVYRAKKDS